MSDKFSVVEFINSETVDVVVSNWINEDGSMCSWPPFKDSGKISKAVSTLIPCDPDWDIYKIKILNLCGEYGTIVVLNCRNLFCRFVFFFLDSLTEARRKAAKAEFTSNLETSENGNTGRGCRK